MKKLNDFLNILMTLFFGVFVGFTIANYWDFKKFPKIYEIVSAPWYFYGALQSFILFIAVILICFLIKFIIGKVNNKKR